MKQEYIILKDESTVGEIALSKAVFETITTIVLNDVKDIETFSTGKFSHAVQCKIVKNKLSIIVNVKVKYGASVNVECEKLQHRINQNILQMTSINCDKIDIVVNGFEINGKTN
ncbi:MAG: Asp23/Gls24 family envelope stress response protein [Anaerorhabdus sp.]